MKLFANKFFLICLCVALVLAIVPSVLSVMGYHSLSRDIVGTVTFPVRWCVSAIADGFEGIGVYFTSINALREENEALREQLRSLEGKVEDALLLEDENERLRSYLGMKEKYPSFVLEEGEIISHSSGNYMTTFTLDKGSIHGIEINMPVITADGIVGHVTEVGLNWCMVSTLIEKDTSVGFMIQREDSVIRGVVSGDYSMRYDGVCKIEYVEKQEAEIKVGDRVLSSGIASVYPGGLEIGTVTEVSINEFTRTPEATVTPSVDFSSLDRVMIVKGYAASEEGKG